MIVRLILVDGFIFAICWMANPIWKLAVQEHPFQAL